MRSLLVVALLSPAPAFAGGYYYSDSGIVAMGRGGAWVAGADTQFAQWYNPAGLIRVTAPTVNVGWSGVDQNISFTREKEDGTFFEPVTNQAKPFSVPEIGFTTPIGKDFVLAIGLYTPFAPSSLYDEEGPQRYSVKDTTILQASGGPSVAWRPRFLPQVVIGAGLNWQFLSVFQSLDITWTGVDDPGGDIAIELAVRDMVAFGGNAGLLIEPVKELSIGLSVLPPMTFKTTGSAGIDFTGNAIAEQLEQQAYEDSDVVATIDLPLVLRAGVAVRPVPKLEIEGAAVWQRWSANQDIVVTDVNVALEAKEGGIVDLLVPEEDRTVDDDFIIPQNLKDTVSLRLGAEYAIVPELEWRVGGFWENGAVPTTDLDVSLVDTDKVQLGTGASAHLLEDRLRFDAGFAVQLFQDAEVRDSTRVQTDAGVIPGIEPKVVGNGDYSSSGWTVGVAAQWAFRKQG